MSEWKQELVQRIEGLGLRPEREADIVEELAQHLDDRVQDLVAGGATMDAARAVALADLDAPGELGRRLREILGRQPLRLPPPGAPARGRWLHARWQDLHYGIRSLRRSPTFAATVIVTLGLTIGPTTAMLSIGNWLLWRPPPGVAAPERLGLVSVAQHTERDRIISRLSYLNLDDLRRSAQTFNAISGVLETSVNLAAGPLPAQYAPVGFVTADFFETLGVRVIAGRSFQPDDDRLPRGSPVVVISDGFARRAFSGATEALGHSVLLNGQPMTVIGVLPRAFTGIAPFSRVVAWSPGAAYEYVNHFQKATPVTRSGGLFTSFVVRLRRAGSGSHERWQNTAAPDPSFTSAQAELNVLLAGLAERHPDENQALAKVQATVTPNLGFPAEQRAQFVNLVRILMIIGGVLLLLGCANVGNLMVMRGVRSQRELGVRLALGASRSRLVLMQLTESAILAGGGAVAGVALAVGLKQFVATLLVPQIARWSDFAVPLDIRVLAMTAGVSIGCGLVAGVLPAFLGARTKPAGIINIAGGRTHTGARRLRTAAAALQLTLSLALVTSAFMLIVTLQNLSAVNLGFHPDGVSVHQLDASRQGYRRERTHLYYQDVFQRLRGASPRATLALAATGFGPNRYMRMKDPTGGAEEIVRVMANAVTSDYFDTLGIRLIRGRTFADWETLAVPEVSPPLIVVSETLARRVFGDRNPIGQRLLETRTSGTPPRELTVIGVTSDVRWNLTDEPVPELYLPLTSPEYGIGSVSLLIRSSEPLGIVSQRVEAAAMSIDPTLPIRYSGPFSAEIRYKLRERTTFAWVLSSLGWLGLVLAAVGLYGILAQSVVERTKEFGIRIAIGSGRAHIFGLVLRQAGWIGVIGTIGGLSLAFWGSRLIEAQLFGVTPSTPGVYAAAAAVLVGVVLLAGLWPAHAATRVDPVEALRVE